MTPLVSVLIPSLWRFDKLLLAIRSFYATADKPERIQMLVRLHHSDEEAWGRRSEINGIDRYIRVLWEANKPPGAGNEVLWNELLPLAHGLWHQYWSDDMQIVGKGWDTKLGEVPLSGYVAHPMIHKLNESIYSENIDGPVPFVPAWAMKHFGYPIFTKVPDLQIHEVLIKKQGWKPWYLDGITVEHSRVEDRTTAIANAG